MAKRRRASKLLRAWIRVLRRMCAGVHIMAIGWEVRIPEILAGDARSGCRCQCGRATAGSGNDHAVQRNRGGRPILSGPGFHILAAQALRRRYGASRPRGAVASCCEQPSCICDITCRVMFATSVAAASRQQAPSPCRTAPPSRRPIPPHTPGQAGSSDTFIGHSSASDTL